MISKTLNIVRAGFKLACHRVALWELAVFYAGYVWFMEHAVWNGLTGPQTVKLAWISSVNYFGMLLSNLPRIPL